MSDKDAAAVAPGKPLLSLTDAVSIIVGIVIGSTIYRNPPIIFTNSTGPLNSLALWGLGGLLAFIGALCYAELASTYPKSGGDYHYLSRAFGPWAGFLFGWGQLTAVLTAGIGMMAFIFAEYAANLWNFGPATTVTYALAAIAALTAVNMLGIVFGKNTQNVLTVLKVVGLGGILVAGFGFSRQSEAFTVYTPASSPDIGLAMILILYAYGGWNDAAFVAAEVRNPQRNIPLALLAGTAIIMVIYVAVNAAYIQALGFDQARKFGPIAADTMQLWLGEFGSKGISILVMISALGAVNGLILTGSHVYESMGREYAIFASLGSRNETTGAPTVSLVVQSAIAALMVIAVGTEAGRGTIDRCLTGLGLEAVPWDKYFGGFDTLLAGTAPVFWGFFLLTGLSLFVLRERDADVPRPFKAPLFPLVPLVFAATSFFMLYRSISYAQWVSMLGAVPLAVGLLLYRLSPRRSDEPSIGRAASSAHAPSEPPGKP